MPSRHHSGRSLEDLVQQRDQQQQQQQQQRRTPQSAPSSGNTTNNNNSRGAGPNNNQRRGGGGPPSGGGGGGDGRRGGGPPRDGGGGGGGGEGRRGGGGGGGGRRNSGQPQPSYKDMPLEQGVVCTLKESFGFIHCADRNEEIFFHYSQVLFNEEQKKAQQQDSSNGGKNLHPSDALQLGAEVEFRVGDSQKKDASKPHLSAFQVRMLPQGTIVWETVDQEDCKGVVDRGNPRPDREGILRRLPDDFDVEQDTTAPAPMDGASIPFGPNDAVNRISRGDVVQFTLVTERRTKQQFARNLKILRSERERLRQEEEKRMLAEATMEQGVITSLKGDYGFLRSNKRREEVYFHYSSIELVDNNSNNDDDKDNSNSKNNDSSSQILKEGQEMKFLVVTEKSGGSQDRLRRLSARQVQLQPRGSVKFHDVLATGVTGTVSMVPQPQDSGHALETKGKILLSVPIDDNYEGQARVVEEVYVSSQDSPGGTFDFRGGSSVGLWIEVGDTLLFDVVKDYSDGACRAIPTTHKVPCDDPLDFENVLSAAAAEEDDDADRAIRMISVALAMRSEGTVNALKESYGFIHFAERPVDAHFKLFQILPDEIQNDLRRFMGIPNVDSHGRPFHLDLGAEVQFDMSVHGSIQSHSARQRGQKPPTQTHERENLKAQRVLLLPPGTILQTVSLGTGRRGVVTKDNPKQPYSGSVDLDEPVDPMSLEVRHPLVAKMIDDFLANERLTKITYHDLQSVKEDEVIMEMIERRGQGRLKWYHIKEPGEHLYAGRLCIEKMSKADIQAADAEMAAAEKHAESSHHSDGHDLSESKDDRKSADAADDHSVDSKEETTSSHEDDRPNKPPKKKKQPKANKPVTTIRFDKSNLVKELKDDMPPGVGDIVELDVTQFRRTGQFQAENMKMIQRHVPEVDASDVWGIGVVKELVPAHKFGFITVVDEDDKLNTNNEVLFFDMASVVASNGADGASQKKGVNVRKGDEVKFNIGTEKSGKRVALNVTVLSVGAVYSKMEKDACRGLILLEPTHTTLKTTPIRRGRSNVSGSSDKSSRWDSVDEDRKQPGTEEESTTKQGCILLIDDPSKMFSSNSTKTDSFSDTKSNDSSIDVDVHTGGHLHYTNGAFAAHGSGSASANDDKPRRGDLVSFLKTKKGEVRDIRVVRKGAASFVRGRLESIQLADGVEGSAKFIATEHGDVYTIPLSEVVSCELSVLKEKEAVEGLLYEGTMHGVCRTADLYLESKIATASHSKQRPKLNLTVKKDRGGKIMAQSMMAKGPEDGAIGFSAGWTKRMSAFVTPFVPHST